MAFLGLPGLQGTLQKNRKRNLDLSMHDISLPDHKFYRVLPDSIIEEVCRMCDAICDPIRSYSHIDPSVQQFVQAAKAARNMPALKQVNVAVLGDQGMGKSTLVNALLDRKLLDRSGSSKACTSFCTVITYKEGFDDQTDQSHVEAELFSAEEMTTCVMEQIQNWTSVYPGQDDNDDDDDAENLEDSKRSACNTGNALMKEDSPEPTIRLKLSSEQRRLTSTAQEFFEIIFQVDKDNLEKERLLKNLYETDISKTDFAQLCIKRAIQRREQIGHELTITGGPFQDTIINDRQLSGIRAELQKLWPFVKVFKIATGHVILRYGICFFDLPGYGDTSHLRVAVIDRFRDQADFEMVITRFSRIQDSDVQRTYLERSIRAKGPENTMLVLNKSDDLINENDLIDAISQLDEEPFVALTNELQGMERAQLDETIDQSATMSSLKKIVREATEAYIRREVEMVEKSMAHEGVKIFATSAKAYETWQRPMRTHDPNISQEMSGIHTLRTHLLTLHASFNYRNWKSHVFNTLPNIQDMADNVIKKHVEDKIFATMRVDLEAAIPPMKIKLEDIMADLLERTIAKPWQEHEMDRISRKIITFISRNWINSLVRYTGFAKLIRSNGIALSGKYAGRNLNDDLLSFFKGYVEQWHNIMASRVQVIATELYAPANTMLCNIQLSIDNSSVEKELRMKTRKYLEYARIRIREARDALRVNLRASLKEVYIRYSTEVNIECPVAMAMSPIFKEAANPQAVQKGHGAYRRTREYIAGSISVNGASHNGRSLSDQAPTPMSSVHPLLENLSTTLVQELHAGWQVQCELFKYHMLDQLNEFSESATNLLMNNSYTTKEHKHVRMLLNVLLVKFKQDLTSLQQVFHDADKESVVKKQCHQDRPAAAPESTHRADKILDCVDNSASDGILSCGRCEQASSLLETTPVPLHGSALS